MNSFIQKLTNNKLEKWKLYAAIAVVVVLAVVIGVREYQHHQQVKELKQQVSTAQEKSNVDKPTVVTLPDNTPTPTPAQISGAGDISSSMAKEFAKEVASKEKAIAAGKAKDQYVYTVEGTGDDAITQFNQQVAAGTAPLEVKKADFVTATKTDSGTTTKTTPDGNTQTVQQSTVKINSYYNYEPSVYYVPQAYPDTLKRHDIIYTNRDFLFDVNYDADREGNKVGVAVGIRLFKW